MNLSGSWKSGILSAVEAFSLALSVEAFRSPLLFWICYILTWVVIGTLRLRGELHAWSKILISTIIYALAGLIPLALNLFPLSIAIFIVLTNIAWGVPDRHIRIGLRETPAVVLLIILAFILVLIGGYIPEIFIPMAYALGVFPILMVLLNRTPRTQDTGVVVVAGIALIVILAFSGQWELACGTAGASSLITFVLRFVGASRKLRALEHQHIDRS